MTRGYIFVPLTVLVTTCTRSAKEETNLNHSIGGRGGHEVPRRLRYCWQLMATRKGEKISCATGPDNYTCINR